MHLGPFHKDQQYHFLSSRKTPQSDHQTKKQSMGPSLRKKCDNQILEFWISCTTPTRPSGFHPPKTCSEVTSFSSTTCRFATGPKDCFYLGFQDFLFHIILAIGFYPAWLPNNFSKNESHLIWNKGDGFRVVWTFIFRSRAWRVSGSILYIGVGYYRIILLALLGAFILFIYFGPNPSSVHQLGSFECILYVMCCQLYAFDDFQWTWRNHPWMTVLSETVFTVRFNLKDHKDQGPEESTTYEPVSVKVSCSAWKWFWRSWAFGELTWMTRGIGSTFF